MYACNHVQEAITLKEYCMRSMIVQRICDSAIFLPGSPVFNNPGARHTMLLTVPLETGAINLTR